MIIFDAHCDTITRLMETKENLYCNTGHWDLQRTKKYTGYVQMFAAWIDPAYNKHPLKRSLQIIDTFFSEIENNQKYIHFVTSYEQMMKVIERRQNAALLSIEGGEALEGDLSVLRMLYRLGVRSICLTWNGENEIGSGVGEDVDKELTEFGIHVVKEMNKLGMIIDVSHLAPKGFWDVVEHTTKPIIASHSNSKTICNHKRNLTDDQFKAIIRLDGMVGINMYADFLNNSGTASVEDIIRHIEHFMSLGGEDHIGLGADFDGIDQTPQKVEGIQSLDIVFNNLLKLNYTQQQVEKIAGNNFIQLVKKII